MVRLEVFGVATGLLIAATAAQSEEKKFPLVPDIEGAIAAVDVASPAFEPTEGSETVQWQHEFDSWPRSRFLRIHFGTVSLPTDGSVKVVLADRSGNPVETMQGAALASLSGQWSKAIPSSYALLSVVGDRPPTSAKIQVVEVAYTTTKGTRLSVIGVNNLQDFAEVASDPVLSAVSNSVAKLSFMTDGGLAACTGFMVNDDMLMTNNHCINTANECSSAVAIFNYQRLADGRLNSGTQYRCTSVVDQDYDLDYSILRLEGSPGQQWGFLQLSTAALTPKEPGFIVEHPGGRPKMVAEVDCVIEDPVADGRAQNSDLSHVCDTEAGSSGSPLFNKQGRVVGLHHFGVADAGQYWDKNRAVLITNIIKNVGAKASLSVTSR